MYVLLIQGFCSLRSFIMTIIHDCCFHSFIFSIFKEILSLCQFCVWHTYFGFGSVLGWFWSTLTNNIYSYVNWWLRDSKRAPPSIQCFFSPLYPALLRQHRLKQNKNLIPWCHVSIYILYIVSVRTQKCKTLINHEKRWATFVLTVRQPCHHEV